MQAMIRKARGTGGSWVYIQRLNGLTGIVMSMIFHQTHHHIGDWIQYKNARAPYFEKSISTQKWPEFLL